MIIYVFSLVPLHNGQESSWPKDIFHKTVAKSCDFHFEGLTLTLILQVHSDSSWTENKLFNHNDCAPFLYLVLLRNLNIINTTTQFCVNTNESVMLI